MQNELEFPVDTKILAGGNIQMGSDFTYTNDFYANNSTFASLDLFGTSEYSYDRVLAAKVAFIVQHDLTQFDKAHMFSTEAFEKVSKNLSTWSPSTTGPNQITFNITKRIMVYSLQSQVDFYHFDLRSADRKLSAHEQELLDKVVNVHADGIQPDIISIHRNTNFNNFFNMATNICLYKAIENNQTLITCYVTSSLTNKTARSLGFFVNFKKSLEEEVLYTVNQIMAQ